jgi:hypothetical protein
MEDQSMAKFKVVAEIRYHVDIGVFEADSKEGAIARAEKSDEWERQSRKAIGGIYDAEASTNFDETDINGGISALCNTHGEEACDCPWSPTAGFTASGSGDA